MLLKAFLRMKGKAHNGKDGYSDKQGAKAEDKEGEPFYKNPVGIEQLV